MWTSGVNGSLIEMATSKQLHRAALESTRESGIHIKESKQGSLHSAMGVKQGNKIPISAINSRLAGNPSEAMRKKLQFAKNARSWGH
jgi:hypothetical protein